MKDLTALSAADLDTVVGGMMFSATERSNFFSGKMYGVLAGLSRKGAQRQGMLRLELGRKLGGAKGSVHVSPNPPLL